MESIPESRYSLNDVTHLTDHEGGLEACRGARNREEKTPQEVALDSRTADFIQRFAGEDW